MKEYVKPIIDDEEIEIEDICDNNSNLRDTNEWFEDTDD